MSGGEVLRRTRAVGRECRGALAEQRDVALDAARVRFGNREASAHVADFDEQRGRRIAKLVFLSRGIFDRHQCLVQSLPHNEELTPEQGRFFHRSNASDVPAPLVSIIVPAYNRASTTAVCLESLYVSGTAALPVEIIVADDASADETATLQDRFPHIRIISNTHNVGFIRNCNRAAAHARGRFLVFLNNDTIVFTGWLDWLLETIQNTPSIGSVGSKVLLPDGRLSEAGLQILPDGSGLEYGVFGDPEAPQYNYKRDVDCNGGCSLLIRNDLFREIGGFNELYAPAYMDDFDLGLAVWAKGYANVYQPKSRVMHVNFVSHGASQSERLYARNRPRFARRWARELRGQPAIDPARRDEDSERAARHRHGSAPLLVIDSRPWDDDVRMELLALRNERRCVQYAPLTELNLSARDELQQGGIEVVYSYGKKTLDDAIFDSTISAGEIACAGRDVFRAYRIDPRWPATLRTVPYPAHAALHA